jgi:cytochrome b6-f complex iron-sulfur subunit
MSNRRSLSVLQRRDFIGVCASLAAAPLAAACASVLVRQVPVSDGRVALALAQHPELQQAGATLQVLPDGEAQPLIVIVGAAGEYAALSSECTHRGCTVEVEGDRLVCPCHGSTYDRKGDVLRGPAERSLRRYPTRVTSDGVLLIDLRA